MAVQVPSQAAVITATPRDHIAVGGQVEMATSGQKLLAVDEAAIVWMWSHKPRSQDQHTASPQCGVADMQDRLARIRVLGAACSHTG